MRERDDSGTGDTNSQLGTRERENILELAERLPDVSDAGGDDDPLCTLCGVDVPRSAMHTVNGRPACADCAAHLVRELTLQVPDRPHLLKGILGGAVPALVAAAIWAPLGTASGVLLMFLAAILGYMAGFAARFAARPARGRSLQIVAAVAALGGLVLARVAAAVLAAALSDGSVEGQALVDELARPTAWDAAAALLAMGLAFHVPRASRISVW